MKKKNRAPHAILANLTEKELEWIEMTLSNDEDSDDPELREYFVEQGLTTEQADFILQFRSDYLNQLYLALATPLRSLNPVSWRPEH